MIVQALNKSSLAGEILRGFFRMVIATDNFAGPAIDEDKYVVHEDIPLFDEHIGEDGVHYDDRLLRRIAQNNNDRIADTNDYVPIVQWHTKEDGTPEEDPPVLGFAGPFYVAGFGNVRKRPCIYAKKVYIYKDAEPVWRRRPRRSVEMWPESKPEERFFDPIALLGAETPKRDLGMALNYSKATGKPKIRYSMATAPSGANTFVPTTGSQKRRRNEKGESMDQVAQILEGLQPIFDEMTGKIDTLTSRVDQLEGGTEAPPEEGLPPGDGDLPGAPPVDDLQTEAGPPVDDLSAGEPMPEEGGLPEEMPAEEYDDEFGGAVGKRFAKRYMMGDEPDVPGAMSYMKGMGDDDRKHLDHYMKYKCDDEGTKDFYARACGKENYQKLRPSESVLRYKKERDDLAEKYAKAESRAEKYQRRAEVAEQKVADLSTEIDDKIGQARSAQREKVLYQKTLQGYTFDLDEERNRVAEMSDDEFGRHMDAMENYPRASSGDFLPTDQSINTPVRHQKKGELSEKYAKRARDVVQQYRKEGRALPFRDVLSYMVDNQTGNFSLEKFDSK